jgi:predicted GIY-YIG superfamily endonuclease
MRVDFTMLLAKDELNIRMLTYALACENGKYYIGRTFNLNIRYAQHLAGRGAFWTEIHRPISIMEVWWGDHEKDLCLEYMREYGFENVRGAGWCKMIINKPFELLSCPTDNELHIRNSRNDSEKDIPDNVGEHKGGGSVKDG